MFGNSWNSQPASSSASGFTFGQPQQQQQQPQQQSAFTGFGQQQQPQQQQGVFGGFGSAFGAKPASTSSPFGAPATTASTTTTSTGGGTSLFGQPAPAASSSFSFGSTPAPSTGMFGQSQSGSMFGSSPFGSAAAAAPMARPTQGTLQPAYEQTITKPEPKEADQSVMYFQNICMMPAYADISPEELRLQDYAAGRKVASAAPASGSMFGQGSNVFSQQQQQQQQAPAAGDMFGSAQPQTNSLFGSAAPSTGLFGQPQQQQTTSMFGQPQQQSGGLFGQTQSGGLFGNTAANSAAPKPFTFGAAASTPAAPPTFGGFGQTPAAPSGGLFGQQQPAAAAGATSTFGGFGAKPASTGLFGQPAAAAPATNMFGQAQPASGGGLFGNTNTATQQPAASGGLFGNLNNNNAATPAANPFAAAASQPAASPFSFGNAAPAQGSSLFGNNNTTTTNAASFGGLFGNASNNTTSGGLFGAKPATTGLFGQTQTQTPAANPFAPAAASSNPFSFGSAQQTTTAPATGGLFGNSTANTNNTSGGLFGSLSNTTNNNTTATPFGSSLFGNTSQNNTNSNSLSFMQSGNQQQQQQQQQLNASLDSSPYGANPLFDNIGPQATPLFVSKSSPAKKQTPLSASYRVSTNTQPSKLRLRGFGSSSTLGQSYSPATSLSQSKGSPKITSSEALSPHAFVTRPSVKKLVIDRRLEDLSRSGSPSSLVRSKVSFNPQVDQAAQDDLRQGYIASPSRATITSTTPRASPGSAAFPTSSLSSTPIRKSISQSQAITPLKQGDYYTEPSMPDLLASPYAELTSVVDFVVGRVGYGEVHFLEPVDLTSLKIKDIPSTLVVFEDKVCTVYPEESGRPPVGEGLNVPARITLQKCWPMDKATRQPIKEADHPKVESHIKKLKSMDGTTFESYDIKTGVWIFSVQNFAE